MPSRISGPSLAIAAATLATLVVAVTAGAQSPSPGPSVAPSTAPLPSPASPRSDAVCDLFLTADQVEASLGDVTIERVEAFDNRPGGLLPHLTCTWAAGPGQDGVTLDIDDLAWAGEPFLIGKHAGGTPIPGLGIEAYAVSEQDYVAWAEHIGDVDRTLILTGIDRTTDQLVALARLVNSAADPGAGPSPAPAMSPPSGAAALVGTWLVTGWSEGELPAKPPVTFVFGADGTAVITADCRPAKGSKKPVKRSTYTVEGDELTLAPSGWKLSCRSTADNDFVQTFGLISALATQPGTWSVEGDVLRVDGSAPGSLTLVRTPTP